MAQSGDDLVFIYTTLPDPKAAEALGEHLVRAKLAACVNIFGPMRALYEWRGALEHAEEIPMFIKTRRGLAPAAIREARARHPYETPIFAVLPLESVNADYLAWAHAQTAQA
jgi:periplasmic divalent cation tolerance protein